MGNLPFVLWLLGWPLIDSIDTFLIIKTGRKPSDNNAIVIFIWIFVAILLYGI